MKTKSFRLFYGAAGLAALFSGCASSNDLSYYPNAGENYPSYSSFGYSSFYDPWYGGGYYGGGGAIIVSPPPRPAHLPAARVR